MSLLNSGQSFASPLSSVSQTQLAKTATGLSTGTVEPSKDRAKATKPADEKDAFQKQKELLAAHLKEYWASHQEFEISPDNLEKFFTPSRDEVFFRRGFGPSEIIDGYYTIHPETLVIKNWETFLNETIKFLVYKPELANVFKQIAKIKEACGSTPNTSKPTSPALPTVTQKQLAKAPMGLSAGTVRPSKDRAKKTKPTDEKDAFQKQKELLVAHLKDWYTTDGNLDISPDNLEKFFKPSSDEVSFNRTTCDESTYEKMGLCSIGSQTWVIRDWEIYLRGKIKDAGNKSELANVFRQIATIKNIKLKQEDGNKLRR